MKILHTADLHIGSSLGNFPPETAKKIKAAQLSAFNSIADYARKTGAKTILIAGDLFDTSLPPIICRENVLQIFKSYNDIDFYMISGNHDNGKLSTDFSESLPNNVHIFGNSFSHYDIDDMVSIYAAENPSQEDWSALKLDENKINIVMAHAEINNSYNGNYCINPDSLKYKAIDYLALGHYHTYSTGKCGRNIWCMSGTPCARGFDETGIKGFVEIDIENHNVSHKFIPIEGYKFYTISIDISKTDDYYQEIINKIKENDIHENDFLKVYLTGKKENLLLTLNSIENRLVDNKFISYADIVDKTTFFADDFSHLSLYSEFRAMVEDTIEDENAKQEILRYGYLALKGEEVDNI